MFSNNKFVCTISEQQGHLNIQNAKELILNIEGVRKVPVYFVITQIINWVV
jgi:hypothetical protein